jgi:hypothetical protein
MTQMAIKKTRTRRSSCLALVAPAPLRAQVQALHGGALLVSWEAHMAVPVLAWMISCLDSAAGEAVVVVAVVKFQGLEGEGSSLVLGVVRMAHHCHQLWVLMIRVRVAGSKVMTGVIGGVGEMVVVGAVAVDTMVVGALEDLVVGVAHGGMDQVEWVVGVDVTDIFMIFCLSVWHSFFPWYGVRTLR